MELALLVRCIQLSMLRVMATLPGGDPTERGANLSLCPSAGRRASLCSDCVRKCDSRYFGRSQALFVDRGIVQ